MRSGNSDWDNKAFVLAVVQQKGMYLRSASKRLQADRDVVLAAVKQDGLALQHASPELQADREVVTEAVQQDGLALKYASPKLRADREVVMAAVQQSGRALEHASPELQADREVVMAAVQQSGRALAFASKELRADQGVVLAAVQNNGWALQHASLKLRADRDVVLAAVQQKGLALQHASPELQADREIVMAAVHQHGQALQYASEELKKDRELVLAAVQNNGLALGCASEKLREDREVVLKAVQKKGWALQYASEELRADREVVMAAVQTGGMALQFASPKLRADREVTSAAVQQNPFAILDQKWVIRFETKQDLSIHRDAFKRQAKILSTLRKGSAEYLTLATCHLEHFLELSKHDIDCISDMFIESKTDHRVIEALLLSDIPERELNDCLLNCFKIGSDTGVIEKLSLEHLKYVKDRLYHLQPEKKAKWDNFIYSLKEKGLVQDDDDVPNLVFTPKKNHSQSASSSSGAVPELPRGVASQQLGELVTRGPSPLSIEEQVRSVTNLTNASGRQPLLTGNSNNSGAPGTESQPNANCVEGLLECADRCTVS